jgi:hypothetical protein
MDEKHTGWVASLSNGETAFEFTPEPEDRSAWGQLIDRCKEEGIWVTQIQLQVGGKTHIGIHGADGYCYFRDYRREGFMTERPRERHHVGIGSVLGDTVYCTVLDEQLASQQDARPLASMRLHCVLKPA